MNDRKRIALVMCIALHAITSVEAREPVTYEQPPVQKIESPMPVVSQGTGYFATQGGKLQHLYRRGRQKVGEAYTKGKAFAARHKKELVAGTVTSTTLIYLGYKIYRVLIERGAQNKAFDLREISQEALELCKGDASKAVALLQAAYDWAASYAQRVRSYWLGGEQPRSVSAQRIAAQQGEPLVLPTAQKFKRHYERSRLMGETIKPVRRRILETPVTQQVRTYHRQKAVSPVKQHRVTPTPITSISPASQPPLISASSIGTPKPANEPPKTFAEINEMLRKRRAAGQ